MSPRPIFKIFYSVLFLTLLFGSVLHAHALTVSPARIEVSGDPGTTVRGTFTLTNEQLNTETFYASYENFSAQGESGTPSFSNEKTDLDTWIKVSPEQVTLEAGKTVTVPYSIAIPATAEPGGYFAAIFWSNTPPNVSGTQVSIGAKIGLLVLLRVNGTIAEAGGITQFDRNGHSFFYTSLPVIMRYKFRNDGADRVEPIGTVTIRDTVFLKSATLNANASQGNILPGSVRQFSIPWQIVGSDAASQGFFQNVKYQWQNFAIGLYSAHLNVAYGTEGTHATKTVWFFVLPWQLTLCMLAVLLAAYWAGRILIGRYNRYIIRNAQSVRNDQS